MKKILSLVLGLLWALPVWGALPTGYTQLEYINMQTGSYLQTDIVPTYDGRVEMDFQTTSLASYSSNLGGRSNTTQGAGLNFGYVSNKFVLDAFGSSRYTSDVTPVANTRYKFTFNNKVATLESGGTTLFTNTFTGENANGAALAINAFNNGGTVVNNTAGIYLYSFKVWNPQGTLIANFVPAKNSSGVIGMYDTVNNRFYTNSGTGEFIAGDPVTDNSCRNLFDKDTADANRIYGFFQQTGTAWHWADAGFSVRIPCKPNTTYTARYNGNDTQAVLGFGSTSNDNIPPSGSSVSVTQGIRQNNPTINTPITLTTGPNDKWLIVAYNVAEPQHSDMANNLQIEESDTATAYVPYCKKIKIATTKYNETAFGPLNTALANAISVVDTVVSNTITQAASIATLQAQKQTRPNDIADDNEKCPAGKKCLLVEDASGIPHWYEIVESVLQSDYTELEYLRSDGRAYINTNYSPTSKTRIEVVAKVDSGAGNINIVGSGRGTTGDAGTALLVINSLDDNTAEIKFAPTGTWIRSENVNMLEKNRLSLSATKFSVNGDVKETNNATIPDTDNQPFYIFQRWRPSIASTNSKTQVYEFSIYENDILVRNMIPVKRNSDGVLGMFDTVNDVFYTNAGDGEFIGGPVAE